MKNFPFKKTLPSAALAVCVLTAAWPASARADGPAGASGAGAGREAASRGASLFGDGALGLFNLPLETQRVVRGFRGVFLEMMAEHLRTPFVAFRYPKGEVLRLPVLGARIFPAEDVELQVAAPAQLWAYGDDGTRRNDTGDITLGTKWTALRERGRAPALGFRWAVKLPNASEQTGLGTDDTDVAAQAIVSKTLFGRVQLDGNLGLSIMGDPTGEVDQVDVVTYGLAASVPLGRKLAGVLEYEGTSGKRRFGSQGNVRVGAAWEGPWPEVVFYGAVSAGLKDHSPEWGLRLGAGWALEFRKAGSPR